PRGSAGERHEATDGRGDTGGRRRSSGGPRPRGRRVQRERVLDAHAAPAVLVAEGADGGGGAGAGPAGNGWPCGQAVPDRPEDGDAVCPAQAGDARGAGGGGAREREAGGPRPPRRPGTPWISVVNANDDRVRAFLRRAEPQVLLSVSTPQRLDEDLLRTPSLAAVNIHGALLPRYAGIAPYFWVLRHGEERTGLTVHVM